MLFYIAGILTGMLLSFAARLADKDITRIVERYGRTGSVTKNKPVILSDKPKKSDEDVLREFTDSMNGL